MLIGWFLARRDIRRRLAALRRPMPKLALPSAGLTHVIDRDGAVRECVGHADTSDGKGRAKVVPDTKRPESIEICSNRAISSVASR